jgi:chorismate mutase
MNSRRQLLCLLAQIGMLAVVGCSRGPTAGQAELEELAAAMDRRLQVAGDVAWSKQIRGSPVRDAAREAAILGRVTTLAEERGIDPAAAREFVEAQLAASRQWQEVRLERWRGGEALPPGTAPDLMKELRPRMDLVTRELLDAWAAWTQVSGRTRFNAAEARRVVAHLRAAGYTEEVARLACGVVVEQGKVVEP